MEPDCHVCRGGATGAAILLRPQGNDLRAPSDGPVLDPTPGLGEGKWDELAGPPQLPLASPPSTFFNHSVCRIRYLLPASGPLLLMDPVSTRLIRSSLNICLENLFPQEAFPEPQGRFSVSLAFPMLLPQKVLASVLINWGICSP